VLHEIDWNGCHFAKAEAEEIFVLIVISPCFARYSELVYGNVECDRSRAYRLVNDLAKIQFYCPQTVFIETRFRLF
jgi:hypothetical protein